MTPDLSAPLRPRTRLLGVLALALVIGIVYARSLQGEPVYDDLYIIRQNPDITSMSNLPRIFSSAYWDFLDERSASHVGYYRPLSSVLLTVGWLAGHGEVFAFHALSVLLHILASIAAWLFATRLCGSERVGFFAALLFALHPLHVESVAWMSAINVPLFALFSFLSLAVWLRWRREGSRGMPWLAGLLLLPALFGKEAAVAVVPMALAIDLGRILPAGRAASLAAGFRPFLRAYAPFVLAGFVYYLARVATFGHAFAGLDRFTTEFGVGAGRLGLLRIELLGGAAQLIAWPSQMNLFRAFIPGLELTSAQFLVPFAWVLLLVAAIALVIWKRKRPIIALLLLLPASIFPVLFSVRSLGTFPLADRFLYLPIIGFTALVAYVCLRKLPRPAAVAVLLAIAGAYGAQTYIRTGVWQNERELFEDAVAMNPRNPSVFWGLGRVLLNEYRETGDIALLMQSQENYNLSMDLLEAAVTDDSIFAAQDDHIQANTGLAWTLLHEAEVDEFHAYGEAENVFQRVIERYPTADDAYVGLAVTNIQMQRPDPAGVALRKAIEINPRSVTGHHNLAALLLRVGDLQAAEHHFREAAKYRSAHLGDLVGLASTLELQGRADEAWEVAFFAHEMHPDAADPALILGLISTGRKQLSDALRWLDIAAKNNPRHARVHKQRGMVLAAMGNMPGAADAYRSAVEVEPGDFETWYNLASIVMQSETPRASIPALVRAYELRETGKLAKLVHEGLLAFNIDDPKVLTELGFGDIARGEFDRGLQWADSCLEADPEFAPCMFLKGLVHKQREEYDLALVQFLQAAERAPENYQVRFETGALLTALGDDERALPHLRAALELIPRSYLPDAVKTGTIDTLNFEISRITGEPRVIGPTQESPPD